MTSHRIGSFVLLAGGVVLVFAGVASALGYSLSGMVASGAAILALLYAGGVWFGGSSSSDLTVVLFTRSLTVASGPMSGRAIAELFPQGSRAKIEAGCRLALDGQPTRFSCTTQLFAASPVRSADGAIVYGILLSGAPAQFEAAAATPAF